ncbi:hypothetical protein HAX54_036007 [Datura stramonium]|uniref:Uncharacterized protein n=1 Tax=Datura stramonium TaxID=4076 RepID=A0ABS8SGQ1_DATST|nr:hypothetical protein [Datura stramonium]
MVRPSKERPSMDSWIGDWKNGISRPRTIFSKDGPSLKDDISREKKNIKDGVLPEGWSENKPKGKRLIVRNRLKTYDEPLYLSSTKQISRSGTWQVMTTLMGHQLRDGSSFPSSRLNHWLKRMKVVTIMADFQAALPMCRMED